MVVGAGLDRDAAVPRLPFGRGLRGAGEGEKSEEEDKPAHHAETNAAGASFVTLRLGF
jgi:hypothetical protein